MIKKTTMSHYQKYHTMKQGVIEDLKDIAFDIVGGDVEGLKLAFEEDENLNNIDKVIGKRKAKPCTYLSKGSADKAREAQRLMNEMSIELQNLLMGKGEVDPKEFVKLKNKISNSLSLNELMFATVKSQGSGWFKHFDEFFMKVAKLTAKNRKGSGGFSLAENTSLIKHIMVYDLIGVKPEFEG